MKVKTDFQVLQGKIKPMHGVCNGPVCSGETIDLSGYFREAKIPCCRLHDVSWPHAAEIDIHTVFPDFTKDPALPESYDFRRTDDYIASIRAVGADIVYRLGESIEHTKAKYYVHPPEDFQKWAQICVGLIRHLNDGFANGHHFGIRYFEIWNEPDNPSGGCMWDGGTPEQYYELYEVAAKAIKSYDPSLRVGGFAATMVNDAFLNDFLAHCRDRKLPLDFFSWHTYTQDPEYLIGNARKVEKLLSSYGFSKTESHLNEWNYAPIGIGIDGATAAENNRAHFEAQHGVKGMSFAAAAMLRLLDEKVDLANYYEVSASSIWGLFDPFGVPYRSFDAFRAFGKLYGGERVRTESENGCCAASRMENDGYLMIANPEKEPLKLEIEANGSLCGGWISDEKPWREFSPEEKFTLSGYSLCVLKYRITE